MLETCVAMMNARALNAEARNGNLHVYIDFLLETFAWRRVAEASKNVALD